MGYPVAFALHHTLHFLFGPKVLGYATIGRFSMAPITEQILVRTSEVWHATVLDEPGVPWK